jgi:DNA-binding NarL/FixJ family response regulator
MSKIPIFRHWFRFMDKEKKIILLVDDEEIIRTSLGLAIQEAGHEIVTAGDGESAIAVLQENTVDLVITDLMMEPVDGIQLLDRIKHLNSRIPVIILTAYGDMNSAIDALRLGADDYLLKPCNIDELMLRVSNCLEKRDLWQQLARQNSKLAQEVAERATAERRLAEANVQLEERVRERTSELEETNIALKVLLKKIERDKREVEARVVANVRELIDPLLDKLEKSRLDSWQQTCVEIVKTNLGEIISPFLQNVALKTLKLTPTEIQVANLIRLGRPSKEIAELLNIAPATVDVHRKNIRKKTGITNKKINLRTILDIQSR